MNVQNSGVGLSGEMWLGLSLAKSNLLRIKNTRPNRLDSGTNVTGNVNDEQRELIAISFS